MTKGSSLTQLKARYLVGAGQTFTATKGTSFYLLFESTSTSRGEFAFTTWFTRVDGYSKPEPTNWSKDPLDIEEDVLQDENDS